MRHPPYHLRPNKAIDRFLLIEILDILKEYCTISDYTYYGFGGPLLDDCRLIYSRFPEVKVVSIERDINTVKRQKFHSFSTNLDIKHQDFSSFVADFSSSGGEIFWLDYTNLDIEHFNEFKSILQKVSENSIVKITIRAEPPPHELTSENREEKWKDFRERYRKEKWEDFQKKYREERWRDFEEKYYEILPPTAQPTDIDRRSPFIKLLQEMLQIASQQALPAAGGNIFQLLNSSHYNDQTHMLSITGIVCNRNKVPQIWEWFKDWRFINLEWENPQKIEVPTLSIKERLHLEKSIPTGDQTGQALSRVLKYKIDRRGEHIKKLKQYEEFHQYYPYFARVLF